MGGDLLGMQGPCTAYSTYTTLYRLQVWFQPQDGSCRWRQTASEVHVQVLKVGALAGTGEGEGGSGRGQVLPE